MSKFGGSDGEDDKLSVDKSGGLVGVGSSNLGRARPPQLDVRSVGAISRAVTPVGVAGVAVLGLFLLLNQKPDQQLLDATIRNQEEQTQQLKEFKKVLQTATRPNVTVGLFNEAQPQQPVVVQPAVQYYQQPQSAQVNYQGLTAESEYRRLSAALVNDYSDFLAQWQTWEYAISEGSPEPTAEAFRRIAKEHGWR